MDSLDSYTIEVTYEPSVYDCTFDTSLDLTREVEYAVRTGRADIELASGREVYQAAIDAVIAAERVDPGKLHRRINVGRRESVTFMATGVYESKDPAG